MSTLTAWDQVSAAFSPFEFQFVNEKLQIVSDQVGFPVDQLRLIASMLIAYPLAAIYGKIQSEKLKHWMNICIGVLMAQFVYEHGWLHSLISSSLTYLLLACLPIHYAPYVVFLFNMAYVVSLHLYRISVDYMGWRIDSTGSQMLLVIKLTSFAYNYYDGMTPEQCEPSDSDSPQLVKMKKTRKELAVHELPSLVEFFGFVYCFTTFLAGPAFEFKEYIDTVRGSKFVYNGKHKAVSPIRASMNKCLTGLFFMTLLVVFGQYADVWNIFGKNESMAKTFLRVMFALFLTRAKYYCAWKLGEGSTVLTGAGFEGFDQNGIPKGWNGVSNIDIPGFEFAQSLRDLSRAWNKGTQLWLERYVYSRTGNSLFLTYLCSAVWHGFYPGYYIFFLSVPLLTAVNRLSRRHLRPYFLERDQQTPKRSKPAYDIMGAICTSLGINYIATCFVLLSWEECMRGLKSMYFGGHLALSAAYFLIPMVPSATKKSKQA